MIEVIPYQPRWADEFQGFARELRAALADIALAIHHIGSTSVPGLAAKDIIDIQITVESLEAPFGERLEALGLVRAQHRADHCPPGMDLSPEQLEKRLFRNLARPMNIHIRVQERFNQRYAVLCRDYLRAHPAAAHAYADLKRQLARYFPDDIDAYYDIKDPALDMLMAGAFAWAAHVGWQPPPGDA